VATLNITYDGLSADCQIEVDYQIADPDVRRIAIEILRTGGVPGLHIANLPDHAFDNFVVDRFDTPAGGQRIYLRPKVPFGA
jgi:hypothetical protein